MTTRYASQFVGVTDGTMPANKADGRQVSAKENLTVATKVSGEAWANGDKIAIGRVHQGELVTSLTALTDTTLGATTVSIGTLANPTKYVNAATVTTVGTRTPLGPLIAQVMAGPVSADEDLFVTLGVGGVAGSVNIGFFTATVGVR